MNYLFASILYLANTTKIQNVKQTKQNTETFKKLKNKRTKTYGFSLEHAGKHIKKKTYGFSMAHVEEPIKTYGF